MLAAAMLWALLIPATPPTAPAERLRALDADIDFITKRGRSYWDPELLPIPERYSAVTILQGWRGTNDDLALVAALPRVRYVSLQWPGLTDRGLHHVGALLELSELSIVDGRVTATGLRELASLRNLRSLSLANVQADDSSMEMLSSLTIMRELRLRSLPIRGTGFAALPEGLVSLHVSYCPVGDKAMDRLRHLRQLEEVVVYRTDVTEYGVRVLGTMPSVRRIVVDDSVPAHIEGELNRDRAARGQVPLEIIRIEVPAQ